MCGGMLTKLASAFTSIGFNIFDPTLEANKSSLRNQWCLEPTCDEKKWGQMKKQEDRLNGTSKLSVAEERLIIDAFQTMFAAMPLSPMKENTTVSFTTTQHKETLLSIK